MRTFILAIFIATLGIVIGGGVVYYFFGQPLIALPKMEEKEEVSSNIVLEKMNKVYKMIVVEGEFADIVDHKEYYGFDLPGFRKRALVKIKAKVSVGYDLDSLKIETDHTNKLIILENWPEPEILSIDADINYYDIENSVFNSFTPEELNQIYAAAKDSIRAQAERSRLFDIAKGQSGDMFEMITVVAEASGWRVVYADAMPATVENNPNIPVIIQTPLPDSLKEIEIDSGTQQIPQTEIPILSE
jgi:hypothetical protein